MSKDYVEIKIDVDRHANGKAVAKRLRGERGGGIPWIVVTDASGQELVTSDGPQGNIGCPVAPHEIEWFMTMLRKSRQNLNDEDLALLEARLEQHAQKLRR